MRLSVSSSLVAVVASTLCLSASAAPTSSKIETRQEMKNGINYNVFEHRDTGATLSYVKNSGICETTPGVNQYSGYLSVGTNMNMFFWFFEARNNSATAPLALWLNGGPGCSSMIGLFQEHGPCHFVNGASTPSLNPYSWNNNVNMLYVDQPIGTGFSYGTDGATSTVTAAPYVWNLLQAFYASFPDYESRDFGLFTESYGGHYGPEFADYFQTQNKAIAAGTLSADPVKLVALGINNGWIDPQIQYKAYADYAANNTYRKLISSSQYTSYINAYNTKCLPAIQKCTGLTGSNSACLTADNTCYASNEGPIENSADFNVYDVRAASNDPNPPETYVSYLQQASVMKAIGATQTYAECPDAPYTKIVNTGDSARPLLTQLSSVVQSGISVLIWAGDTDWICNWMGNYDVVQQVDFAQSSTFRATAVKPYTVQGTQYGEFKTTANLSWLRVYGAGHEVPYYQPQVALQAFEQTMLKTPLHST